MLALDSKSFSESGLDKNPPSPSPQFLSFVGLGSILMAPTSVNALTRHDEYFLNGGDCYLMVDHVVFRVHRYFFERESPYFREMLAGPASPGAHKPGTSESTALILDGLKPAEFARFLWVFYNPKYSIYSASVDDWTVILRLAHRWTFHEVKELAVRQLEKLDSPDIDRIVTYHDYGVDRILLVRRYAALCQREEPLSLEEANRLGMQTTITIVRAREYARGPLLSSGQRSPVAASIGPNDMFKLIHDVFGISAPIEEPVMPSDPTSTATTNGGTAAPPQSNQPETSGANQDPKGHSRSNPVTTANAASTSTSTAQNTNATSSTSQQAPPPPPSKNETPNGKLEKSSGPLGSGADPSKDGKKDDKEKNTPSTDKDANKDANKDAHKGGATNADVGNSRGSGGMLQHIITSVSGQKSDLIDLQKVEDPNGRQSPSTAKGTAAKQQKAQGNARSRS